MDHDLGVVYEHLISIKHRWYVIGLNLGVETSSLDGIGAQYRDHENALLEMLKLWLKQTQTPRTWEALVKALRKPTLSEEKVAKEIESKYNGLDQAVAGMAIMLATGLSLHMFMTIYRD